MKFKDFVEDFEREYLEWTSLHYKNEGSCCISMEIDKKIPVMQMLQFWRQYELERSIRLWAVVMAVSTIIISVANLIILCLLNMS